jgi:hypothetical protein
MHSIGAQQHKLLRKFNKRLPHAMFHSHEAECTTLSTHAHSHHKMKKKKRLENSRFCFYICGRRSLVPSLARHALWRRWHLFPPLITQSRCNLLNARVTAALQMQHWSK